MTSFSQPNDGANGFLFDAIARRGADTLWINSDTAHFVGDTFMQGDVPIGHLDAVIPRYAGSSLPLMGEMEQHGIPMINNQRAITTTWLKQNTHAAYEAYGTPTIPTRFAAKAEDATEALRGLPDDIVVKPHDGEGGNGVEFFTNHEDAARHIEQHFRGSDSLLLVQPRIQGAMVRWETPAGEIVESGMDYRAVGTKIVGETPAQDTPVIVGYIQRVGAPGSGKSNLDAGGWGRIMGPDEAPDGLRDAAFKGYAAIPGNYGMGGIDIMPVGREIDQPLLDHAAESFVVTESNSSPGVIDGDAIGHMEAVADHTLAVALRNNRAR